MKVVLAEKPSVARELAQSLGCNSRRDGYLEGNGYQVTWAFGHLVALNDPEDYDPALKKWALETLPILPEKFGLKPSGDKQARHQLSVIKQLFRKADELIAATDAGREGELIFRYILTLSGCTGKPARRLWLSSLTPQAIQEAFASLKPLSAYDNLYAAARCRSEADWIVGINGTRYFTVRHRTSGELWSVGRVQTPVLAMIAGRDNEIKNFRSTPFWELLAKYRDTVFRFTGGRFEEEAYARTHLQQVTGQPFVIEAVKSLPQNSPPPQLYDLNELQRDMNRRFSLSAAATLQVAQSLYEARLITYPRTDSRYLTKDIEPTIPGILQKLATFKPTEIGRLNLAKLPFTARITNDKKVTDHHAIIPTGTTTESLSPDQQQVFEAIVVRFIAAFSPACEKEVTTVQAQSAGVPFVAKGTRVTVPGWTLLYEQASNEEAAEDEQQLPAFRPGESGPHEPSVRKGQTTPPNPFTENTLLGAMETAGKFVEDAELREALKERGLGTPATRASIIETLLQRKYILRTKTKLTATESGHYLLSLIEDASLKSPEMTGDWEERLKRIERGEAGPEEFVRQIADYTRGLIRTSEQAATARPSPPPAARVTASSLGACPLCQAPVLEGPKSYSCSGWKTGCKFTIWKTVAGKSITVSTARVLLRDGKTSLLKGFKSKSGNSFEARLKLIAGKVEFEFPK